MGPKILTGVGCFLFGISFLVFVISLLLPILNGPRTSWEEAAAGYVPGAVCSCMSFLPMLGGGIWWFAARRKEQGETATPPAPSQGS